MKEQQIEGQVDLIICGESFHWFDTEKALSACHNVLTKSNGILAIWGYKYFYILTKNIEEDCLKANAEVLKDYDRIVYDKTI